MLFVMKRVRLVKVSWAEYLCEIARLLHVEPEQDYISILDDIVLAFNSHFASFLGRNLTAKRDVIVIRNYLSADETLLKICMDGSCSAGSS